MKDRPHGFRSSLRTWLAEADPEPPEAAPDAGRAGAAPDVAPETAEGAADDRDIEDEDDAGGPEPPAFGEADESPFGTADAVPTARGQH